MIIYPPFIADTIPAFITTKVSIPFVMNPAVGVSQIKSFYLQINNYITDSQNKTSLTLFSNTWTYDEKTKSGG